MIEDKLRALGFIIKRNLKIGKNRVPTTSKPDKLNGWIYLNEEAVNYGSWDESIESGYMFLTDKFIKISSEESQKKREEYLRKQKEIEKQERIIALRNVRETFNKINQKCIEHPYLTKKNLKPSNRAKIDFQSRLVIPIYGILKDLMGYQYIDANGGKFYKTGSVLDGSFFPILKEGVKLDHVELILLVEGYATGLSVFNALTNINSSVIVCFQANNVDKVAKIMLEYYPDRPVIAIKDNDKAGLLVKQWGFVVSDEGEDANDVHNKYGLEELTKRLMNHLKYLIRKL